MLGIEVQHAERVDDVPIKGAAPFERKVDLVHERANYNSSLLLVRHLTFDFSPPISDLMPPTSDLRHLTSYILRFRIAIWNRCLQELLEVTAHSSA